MRLLTDCRTLLTHLPRLFSPTDHDIANALSVDLWKEHRVLVDAARRAFFEYQYQLTADVAPDTHAVGTSYEPPPLAEAQRQVRSIYSFITLRRTGLAFMDLRFERTFGLLPDYKCVSQPGPPPSQSDSLTHPRAWHRLTGTRQLRAFEGALREWEGDEQVDAALVFSSVPFLYQAPLLARFADWVENEKYRYSASTHERTLSRSQPPTPSALPHQLPPFVPQQHAGTAAGCARPLLWRQAAPRW